MTTFTKIQKGEVPLIDVGVDKTLSKIDKNIYGGFLEHMGRCIYGGIYDPGNSLSDSNGYRLDVLEALKDLNVPVMRYPGGNFVATYHWVDGVGPKDQRPSRPELAWLGTETNQFGTDEFMKWLELLGNGVQPYIALNFGTGTLDEALAWVEYCNGKGNTFYANLRRKHGREEPYGVKYWALGNEMWGPWQVGQMTKEDYAKRAAQWAKALKLLDPTLCLILCGETGVSSWDHYVLKECIQYIDMHSIHMYTTSDNHLKNAIAPRSAERAIEIAAGLIDLARIEAKVPSSVPRTTICFDEWNVWDTVRARGDLGAEECYTLSDSLAVAAWLNVFIRQSRYIGMANIAQSVNVISPLMTSKDGIVKQTTWWPLLLFCKYMHGETIATHVRCECYEGETEPDWLQGQLSGFDGAPLLDCSASLNDGWVSLVVVNIGEEKDVETEVVGVTGQVQVFTVTGPSIKSQNVAGKEEVGLTESKWDGKGKYKFGKHSMVMLRWKVV